MKAHALRIGKAMSAALFVLLLVAVGMKNALAQEQNLTATLQHNDSIAGVYYGVNALVSAHDAATTGDIITLSSGTFNACDISKAITIHGAGCVYDSVTHVKKTQISGNFKIGIANITFEGIHFSGSISDYGTAIDNVSFVKCVINTIRKDSTHGNINNSNWQFINCLIMDFNPYGSSGGINYLYTACYTNMSIINCVVRFKNHCHLDINKPTTIINSVVLFDSGGGNNGKIYRNILSYNNIIATTVSGLSVSNCTFFNTIGIKLGQASVFDGQTCNTVMEVDNYSDVFETFNGTITENNIYQLKNEIATSFLGHDGTEVGIYGGLMPYSTRPHYMIIRNCNVAGRTTIDNKLSVEIELLDEDE